VGVEPTIRPAKDRIAGFEDREGHRTPFASVIVGRSQYKVWRSYATFGAWPTCSETTVVSIVIRETASCEMLIEGARILRNLFLLQGKVEVESQPDRRLLLVRAIAGVVVMLIVGIEFDVFTHGEQATRI